MRIIFIAVFSVIVLIGAVALASYFEASIKKWWARRRYNLAPYEVHAIPSPNGGTNVVIVKGGKRIQTYKYVRGNKPPEEREAEVSEAIAAAELEARDWNRKQKRDRLVPWRSHGM